MNNQIITQGIVLSRTDFQEADRILTILTPDHGKLRAIAKGVRRPRSKLAGGIELLSISDITYLPGRGDLGTLISTRLITHYGKLVQDIQRTMLAYDFLKKINRATEDAADPEYFTLLTATLEGLNDPELPTALVELWFSVQLLSVAGHAPNLTTDAKGDKLALSTTYLFDFDHMVFQPQSDGPFEARHIKLLRVALGAKSPAALKQITDAAPNIPPVINLVQNLLRQQVRM